jgi:hypothetical protein
MYVCMYVLPYECVLNGTSCRDERDVLFFGEVMQGFMYVCMYDLRYECVLNGTSCLTRGMPR